MPSLKLVAGIVAIILTFVGYVPYYRDILRGKTQPHVYSWFAWALLSMIIFGLQITHGAGLGSFVVLMAGILCIGVFVLGLKNGIRHITKMDTLFFASALVALCLWLLAKQPVLSSILVTLTDVLSFVPTVTKAWRLPHTETLSFYGLNTVRYLITIFSISSYGLVTSLDPVVVLISNAFMVGLLVVRRKKLSKN